MIFSIKVLTTAGLIKIPLSQQGKMRLYHVMGVTEKKILQLQAALKHKTEQGWRYEGKLDQLRQEIQEKPYLLKEKNKLKFISEEEAALLNPSLVSEGEQKKRQNRALHENKTKENQHSLLAHHTYTSFYKQPELFKQQLSVLGQELIPGPFLQEIFQRTYSDASNFASVLQALISDSTLQIASSFPHMNCYQIKGLNQNVQDQAVSYERQKEVCEEIWQIVMSFLQAVIKDPMRGEKGFYLYLNHGVALLNQQPLRLALNTAQKHELLCILEHVFHQETALAKDCALLKDPLICQNIFYDLCRAYASLGEHHLVISCYEKAVKGDFQQDHQREQHLCYSDLGQAHHAIGNYEKALEWYHKELESALKHQDQKRLGRLYGNLGTTYLYLEDYPQATFYYDQELLIAHALKDKVMEAKAYGHQGTRLLHIGKYLEAIESYEKELKISLDIQDWVGEARAYSHLSNAYCILRDINQFTKYYHKRLEIFLKLGDLVEEGNCYSNMGNCHDFLKNDLEAIPYYEKFLDIALQLNDPVKLGKAYKALGGTYKMIQEFRKAADCYEKHLAIVLQLKDLAQEARAYGQLRDLYISLEEYLKADEYHQKDLKLSAQFQEQESAYRHLGAIHDTFAEHNSLIEIYKKELNTAIQLKDKAKEREAYGQLGDAYTNIENHLEAIPYYQKELKIILEVEDGRDSKDAYRRLGNGYDALGHYQKAIECHEKNLMIIKGLKSPLEEGMALNNLGNAYEALGEHQRAIEYHEKAIQITHQFRQKQIGLHGNLGNAYLSLGDHAQAFQCYDQELQIASEFNDRRGMARAYCNLGNTYKFFKKYFQSIEVYEKSLAIFQELKDFAGEALVYGNMGNIYQWYGQPLKALEYLKKSLKLNLVLRDRVGEAGVYGKLGNIYGSLKEYQKAENCFFQSIHIAAALQQDAQQAEWQVTLFERWSAPYLGLEKMLLLQNQSKKSLEASDARRSRALASLISKKFSLGEPSSLTFEQMAALAIKLQTTWVFYSFVQQKCIHVWVISSKGEFLISKSLGNLPDEFYVPHHIFNSFPYKQDIRRPGKEGAQPSSQFKEKLSSWYNALIAPLEPYLPPPGCHETVTFIPDGFLLHLPFGAFYHAEKDQYLIEKYPISITPSIHILALLDKLPKPGVHQALLIGNPTLLHQGYPALKYAEEEVIKIRNLRKLAVDQVLTQQEATVGNFLKLISQANYVHLACHGIGLQKPFQTFKTFESELQDHEVIDFHSIFEGVCLLTPDARFPSGHLHTKNIALMKFLLDLVFMSACHLGRGNLQKEGSIGPIWSFLGSGALSTVAGYWPLPDTAVTLDMVETFYRHYLGIETLKLTKAQALQQAVLTGMKAQRSDIRQWGALFLSGLMGTY
ncbi:MAG: tetratricopeptide repeat protein [Candidatus Rhabdochlamydia sp.]